jgi:hypothetical protein
MKKFDLEKFKSIIPVSDTPWKIDYKWLNKAENTIWLTSKVPWIKMIGVWNSVAMNYSSQNSDIDLFIVTEKNRMRFVRVILTLIFTLFALRKTKNKHSGKFCLSFFATENWLDFKDILIEDDVYMYFWILYFKPIFVSWAVYDDFINTNRFSFDFSDYENILKESKSHIKFYQKPKKSAHFWWKIDKICKFFLEKKTLKTYENLWKPYWITISDDILKFHNNDKRKEIRQKYRELN